MTLGEFFNADFLLEGYRKIQSADEDNPEVYFEGDWEGNIEHLFDREIVSVYPYCNFKSENRNAICIEISEN